MKSFVFEYDMDMQMLPAEGTLTFYEDGRIASETGGAVLIELSASEVQEALVKAGVGCGLLYVKRKDGAGEKILCRFTMAGLKKAGDFCKIVN